jgi:hypothetical protein
MDRATADQVHDLVSDLLELESSLHLGRVVAGHVDHAFVAEEVRRVQQVDVQRVALDPLAAVQQPT